MSTDYYRIALPITQLHVVELGARAFLTLWVDGAMSGTVALRDEELPQMLLLLRDAAPSLKVYFDGTSKRLQFYPMSDLPDNLQLISEYGELTTLGELRSKVGTGTRR